jgi:hypothetical protein
MRHLEKQGGGELLGERADLKASVRSVRKGPGLIGEADGLSVNDPASDGHEGGTAEPAFPMEGLNDPIDGLARFTRRLRGARRIWKYRCERKEDGDREKPPRRSSLERLRRQPPVFAGTLAHVLILAHFEPAPNDWLSSFGRRL